MPSARAVVQVVDGRSNGHVRFSWHPEGRAVVVSHWRSGTCVASTRVGVAEFPALIGLLARALEEVAASATAKGVPTMRSVRRDLRAIVVRWLAIHHAGVAARVARRFPAFASELPGEGSDATVVPIRTPARP